MKNLMIKLIRWYQRNISANRPPTCRYTPTCSNYAIQAFQKRNFFVALFLTIKRILSCNPLFKGGYDPVPEPRKHKHNKSS